MRLPISLPKITKYSVIVIAGGFSVCVQMRMMRTISRRTMVWRATRLAVVLLMCWPLLPRPGRAGQSAGMKGGARVVRTPWNCGSCGGLVPSVLDQAHEQLFEPVGLVAHRG